MNTPSIEDGIAALRKRPRMFLKRDSVRDLCVFLTGYCFGLDTACPGGFPHGNDLLAFRHWLATRLKKGQHDELETMLLSESNDDDTEAFQRFFGFWNEYLSERKT